MYKELEHIIHKFIGEAEKIPDSRKQVLEALKEYIVRKCKDNETALLVFICTHNSRRSHLAQVWGSTTAKYFGLAEQIKAYSGGTEETAFHPNAIEALETQGFKIITPKDTNPRVEVRFDDYLAPLICFSKVYDHPENPQSGFAAIMTCSEADANCPFIPGAEVRISLPYEDPKESDGTPEQSSVYLERSEQIGREIVYLISRIVG